MQAVQTTYDIELKVAEFKINGYTLFENLIPPEKVDRLYAAFVPLLEEVRRRNDPVQRGDVRTGLGRLQNVNRYTVEVPWQPPFSDPVIYEHPALLAFLDRYWGSSDYQITLYSSNNPYPGSEYQKWHRDNTLLTPHVGLPIFPHFGIKFPLVDTDEESGSFEILPGTQYLADVELESRYDELIERGDFPKRRLNMKKGTLWVQDPRALHRGTPNRSDHARPELVIAYSRSWYYPGARFSIDVTAEQFEGLSERGKRLLARWRPNR